MDMAKVIKGLECCQLTYECKPYEECPYSNDHECGYCDIDQLHYDAVALIKEQNEEIENIKQTCQSMMEGVCLMKEQEEKPLRCDKCCYHREDGWCAMQEQWVRETDYCSFGAWEGR